MLQPLGNGSSLRLYRAEFAYAHAFDHYGADGRVPADEWNCATGQPEIIELAVIIEARPVE